MPRLHSRNVAFNRVVITGMGTVNPLGNDVATSWNALCKGVSGVAPLVGFNTEDLPVKFGAQVKGFDPETVLDKKEARRYDKFLQYAMAAAVEAMNDANWHVPPERADRTGVLIGTGIAGLETMLENCEALVSRGPRKISPFFVPYAIANMASGIVSMRYGARGPNTCVVTACTTGTHAIGDAYRILQRGDADVMIAGGVEAPVNRLGVAGFASMRALSTRNDDPQRASRPFDRGRDGFVIAEASGVVVLETLEHALARGARIHAEVVGYGMSGDAHHMTAPPEDGAGAQLSMRAALRDGSVRPEDVGYINAHGTSTELNDKIETYAIKQVFGAHARKLAVSSTKSMTGHALGGAGGIEAIFTVLAVAQGKLPPTINLTDPDPECDLDYVPNVMREAPVRVALSNSFGFGGTNGTLAIARWERGAEEAT
ncbi:MAG TPA: beta-ketoacyl-ACP synthase II [Myxococcota bacterium]|nr:beta-ketoacyl-ACP synthase II [Myxococcota bacterium]